MVETPPPPFHIDTLPGGTRLFELIFGYAGLTLFLRLCTLPPRPELTLHHDSSTSCNRYNQDYLLKLIPIYKEKSSLSGTNERLHSSENPQNWPTECYPYNLVYTYGQRHRFYKWHLLTLCVDSIILLHLKPLFKR